MNDTNHNLEPIVVQYLGLSHAVAIDATYVQGGGGNVSVKIDQQILVKSSGTRLMDASVNSGFVVMDIDKAKACITSGESLEGAVSKHSPPGRPSIEAPLHIVCAGKYVAHVHSVGAVALGLTIDCESVCRRYGWKSIPYVEPGSPLLEALSANPEFFLHTGTAILKNHGLLLWSSSLDECVIAVKDVESICRNYFFDSESECNNYAQMVDATLKQKTVIDFSDTKSKDWLEFVASNILVPDQAVFLSDVDILSRVIGQNVVDTSGLSDTQIEMLQFLKSLGHLVEPSKCVSTVKDDAVKKLLGLDSEKYRQGQSR